MEIVDVMNVFDRDEETGELYDKTSYCMRGQIITESAEGVERLTCHMEIWFH